MNEDETRGVLAPIDQNMTARLATQDQMIEAFLVKFPQFHEESREIELAEGLRNYDYTFTIGESSVFSVSVFLERNHHVPPNVKWIGRATYCYRSEEGTIKVGSMDQTIEPEYKKKKLVLLIVSYLYHTVVESLY